MAALVRDSDIDDAQLGSLMRMVTSKGLSCEQVIALLLSLGVGRVRAVRILQTQGIMGDKEAQRILNEERRAAQEQAADDRRGAWRGRLAKGAIIAFWLVVWQLVDTLVDNRLILTGPVRTLQALGEQAQNPHPQALEGDPERGPLGIVKALRRSRDQRLASLDRKSVV